MADNSNEMVLCHACHNRWPRNRHGLICPQCDSEIVEIIEPDNDNQAEAIQESQFTGDPGSFLGSLFGMPSPIILPNSGSSNPPNSGQRSFGASPTTQSPSSSPHTRNFQYSSPSGNTRITFHSTTIGAGSPGFDGRDPLAQALSAMFVPRSPQDESPRSPGSSGAPPIFQFLNMFGGAQMGRNGDYAWSQEDFDRIVTQAMEQGQTGAPAATRDAISTLPKVKTTKEMLGDGATAECTICMDDVGIDQEVTQLYCKHWFHTPCINFWLNEHNTCPHCRKSIEEAKHEAEEAGTISKTDQNLASPSSASTSRINPPRGFDGPSAEHRLNSSTTLRQFLPSSTGTSSSFARPWTNSPSLPRNSESNSPISHSHPPSSPFHPSNYHHHNHHHRHHHDNNDDHNSPSPGFFFQFQNAQNSNRGISPLRHDADFSERGWFRTNSNERRPRQQSEPFIFDWGHGNEALYGTSDPRRDRFSPSTSHSRRRDRRASEHDDPGIDELDLDAYGSGAPRPRQHDRRDERSRDQPRDRDREREEERRVRQAERDRHGQEERNTREAANNGGGIFDAARRLFRG